MLQFAKMEEFRSVIVILGGFHNQMTFTKSNWSVLGVIGNLTHMGKSE